MTLVRDKKTKRLDDLTTWGSYSETRLSRLIILSIISERWRYYLQIFILFSITKMKNTIPFLSLTTSWWKTYDKLTADRMKYLANERTAFTLFDRDENEPWPFCSISENHPEISDEETFNHLPGHEAIVIDNDFISCFNSEREAKIWIRDNIPECVITGDLEGRPVFYIKHEATE